MLSTTIAAAAPALVQLTAERAGRSPALGTGFLVRKDGLIATAYHLARGATTLRARGAAFEGSLPATLVCKDERADIALLRLLTSGTPALELQSTAREAAIGDPVVAIGFPYGDIFAPPLLLPVPGHIGNRYGVGGVDRLIVVALVAEGMSGGPVLHAGSGRCLGLLGARFDPDRARAVIAGRSEAEVEALPHGASPIAFATETARILALLGTVK